MPSGNNGACKIPSALQVSLPHTWSVVCQWVSFPPLPYAHGILCSSCPAHTGNRTCSHFLVSGAFTGESPRQSLESVISSLGRAFRLVRCLPWRHGHLSSDTQQSHKSWVLQRISISSQHQEWRRRRDRSSRAHRMACLGKTGSSRFSDRSYLKM